MAQAFVGSNPTPRTTYGKTLRGFSRVMVNPLGVALWCSEDFAAVCVFPCDVLETCIDEDASLLRVSGDFRDVFLLILEQFVGELHVDESVLDILVSKDLHDVHDVFGLVVFRGARAFSRKDTSHNNRRDGMHKQYQTSRAKRR